MFFTSLCAFFWKHLKHGAFFWKSRLIIFAVTAGFPVLVVVLFNKSNDSQFHPVEGYMVLANILQAMSSIILILLPIIEENRSGFKEFLRIASSYSYLNLVTFSVVQLGFHFSIYSVVLSVAWFASMTKHFHIIYMLILVLLYVISNIAFMFLISALFKRGNFL